MKVGILTYHNARNVGAALQAYALQNVIAEMGVSCEIIDYRCSYLEEVYRIKNLTEIKSFKELIKWIFSNNKNRRSKMKFAKFNKMYQKISSEVYTKDRLQRLNNNYDIFVVGSDQVWNMNLNGNDTTYLLDFLTKGKKRISYAASFGYKEIPREYVQEANKNLLLFDAISVRETSGSKIVRTLIGKQTQVVLDPTLLLNKDDWEKLNLQRIHNKEYVLLYMVAATPSALKFAKKLANEYSCDVICIHYSYMPKKGVINVQDCSPVEFLSYIKYAKFIISSSFHGICFSILFGKDFFYELDEKPQNNNSRIETLTECFNLKERQIIDGRCNALGKIDYSRVNYYLNVERNSSIAYLSEHIKKLKTNN